VESIFAEKNKMKKLGQNGLAMRRKAGGECDAAKNGDASTHQGAGGVKA
jgi:hypothetical protein